VNQLQRILVIGFGSMGVLHFLRARDFEASVPEYVPISARDAVRWSGVAELVGAAAVAAPATRPFARWWLLGLLAAVYPANIEMAVAPDRVAERGVPIDRLPRWMLWARLPFQALFAVGVWRATE
jgi:uncharacterized membrane protein